MKARRSDTNDQWKEIKYVQLEDSDILYKAEVMEFDVPLSESELYEQRGFESHLQDYWQDVRERAAIAAMQGMIANPQTFEQLANDKGYEKIRGGDKSQIIAIASVMYADALIAELKKK